MDSTRHYVIKDDAFSRISRKKVNDFYLRSKNSLPEYSGEVVDFVDVLVKIENKKVCQVIDIYPRRCKVNDEGGLVKDFTAEYLAYKLTPSESIGIVNDGPIIRAEELFNKIRQKNQFECEIPLKHLFKIIDDVFE